jgi:predicted PurR-regulated permease PerM
MDIHFIWDVVKTILVFVFIPLAAFLTRAFSQVKQEVKDMATNISEMKNTITHHKAEAATRYLPREEAAIKFDRIDLKMSEVQNNITNRIDDLQSTIVKMIASISQIRQK